MRSLLFLLTLISFSFGQYNEIFNDFTGHLNDSTKGKWVFGSGYTGGVDNIGNDQSGNNNDLTASGGFDYTNQLTGTSPIYEGDNALVFDGLNDYWYILAAQAGDFNPGTGDFSVEGWFKTTAAVTQKVVSKRVTNPGWDIYITNGVLGFVIHDGTGGIQNNLGVETCNDGQWHHVVWVYDRDAFCTGYIDKIACNTPRDISGYQLSLNNNHNFTVGAFSNGTNLFNGEIASLTYHAKALTADEINKNFKLGYGWASENANVIRDNVTDWFQCFYADTISANTGVTGKYKFSAKGESGGEVLNVWSGSNNESYTLTTGWKDYKITLDDTLYFASTDTVYVDSIKKSGDQRGYLQYLQYLRY